MADRLIGIDSGGTVTKVGLFDFDGTELASEGRAVPMHIPSPGFTERDPEQMWAATCEAIGALLQLHRPDSGQGPSLLMRTVNRYALASFPQIHAQPVPSKPGVRKDWQKLHSETSIPAFSPGTLPQFSPGFRKTNLPPWMLPLMFCGAKTIFACA